MGNRNSQSSHKTKNFFFGEVIKKKNYGKQYITVTRAIVSKEDFDEWKKLYDDVQTMNNKESLFIPDDYEYRTIKNQNTCGCCCGATGEYDMTYEDIEFLLSSELLNRKNKKAFYSENELLLILYKLLQGSKEFQRKQQPLGDIRPKNILVTKDQDIKMVNVASFPSQKTAIGKITETFDNKTIFYLAPEEVQFLKTRGYSSRDSVPNPKTQAFSIGMTILEAATLQCSQQLYVMPSRGIDEDKLKKRESAVEKKYPLLYEFLSNILKMDASQRMQSGQCWAALRVYSQKISQLQPFKRNKQAENASIRKFFAGVSSNKS